MSAADTSRFHPMDIVTRPTIAARRLGLEAFAVAVSTPQRAHVSRKGDSTPTSVDHFAGI